MIAPLNILFKWIACRSREGTIRISDRTLKYSWALVNEIVDKALSQKYILWNFSFAINL